MMQLKLFPANFFVVALVCSLVTNSESQLLVEEPAASTLDKGFSDAGSPNSNVRSSSFSHAVKKEKDKQATDESEEGMTERNTYITIELLTLPILTFFLQHPRIRPLHIFCLVVINSLQFNHFLQLIHEQSPPMPGGWLVLSVAYSLVAVLFQWCVLKARDELSSLEQVLPRVAVLNFEIDLQYISHLIHMCLLAVTYFSHGTFLSEISGSQAEVKTEDIKHYMFVLVPLCYLPSFGILVLNFVMLNMVERDNLQSAPQVIGG